MDNAPAVRVTDLVVRRRRTQILHGLSFELPHGALVGLLGPSGSGKTTLMRALVGVQKISSGSVSVLGEPAGSVPLRSSVGYVTQQASVYADLTVEQNLRYFASILRVGRDRVVETLESVDLTAHRSSLVSTLSGGQRGRVSLAAALLGTPQLLVLDEPTTGLDPVLRASLWDLFADITARGTTLIVSSHAMDEADHCSRLLLLRDGALIADDSPAGLLRSTGARDTEGAFLALVREARS
ncbi:ABC transporter ATP-binding protein [Herbiconiux sp. L3-i23]|uniref:ABC transporter ATP-binding protein n=1 Tax=Herbiconiux sp. L3-i23 TaxID=2905871 RepID=UPI0020500CFE|nr:ABC transporter ATP-binding protein [Herbiconiux sp. L3-i23]BDI22866.1 multidrug ABC transporter ATP-binding protein [Herbiconiux sp. L3-i23]